MTTALGGPNPGPHKLIGLNHYSDDLPSANLAYQLTDELLIRAGWAKVMARPLLGNLSPSITGLTAGTTPLAFGSLTVGNPELSPFRATNLDLSIEWYFSDGGLFSVAVFKKDVSNFPQTVSSAATLQSLVPPDIYAAIYASQAAAAQTWLTSGGVGGTPGVFAVRQFQDAPGGTIKGYELSYQQDLIFLPGWLKNFGVQANFTHLNSSLSYILDPGSTVGTVSPQVIADGPFLGASPKSANFTLYYETPKWSARASAAYRSSYVTTYPIASGTCAPGLQPNGTPCDAPLMNDFLGSDSTMNLDAQVTWQATDHLSFTVEGLNLTNQTENRWAYQDEPLVTQYSSTGRQIFAGFRLSL